LFWHGDAAGYPGGLAVLLFDTHLRFLGGMRCLCWKVLIKFLIHLLSKIVFEAVKLKLKNPFATTMPEKLAVNCEE